MRTLEHDTVNEINNDDGEECSLKEENLKTNLIDQNAAELLDPSVEGMLNNCSKNLSNTVSLKDEEIKQKLEEKPVNTNFQRPKKRKHKNETEVPANFISETQLSEQSKDVEERQLVSTSEPENKNVESILGLERNTHETLRLNDSTVTVSFEDFVKSQRESKVDQISEVQTPNSSVALGETASSQMPQLLPLKKVTVLAEIHPVPPRSFPSRKIASIFLKHRTKAAKTQSRLSAPEVEFNEQMIQKRKSNVVIAEEELELAELETPSSANAKTKCTTEERYQFMKAFRQPELDTVKNGTKKAPAKQKEVGENPSRVKVEIEESGEASNKKLENEVPEDYVGGDSLNTGKNLTARVKNKKLSRKRVMLETKGEDVNVNENQDGNADCQTKVATSVETQSKLPQGELRRSPRQKKSEAPMNITPEKGGVFKAAAEDTSGGSPLQSSTPKANNNSCSKSDLYKAEMVTELFDSKSPISGVLTKRYFRGYFKFCKTSAITSEADIPKRFEMKFTRISTSEGSSQQSPKMNAACNISKAKKLIEKAKALQHNKARTMEETSRTPLRRSSRQQALAEKKNLQNLEESVIILDSSLSSVPTVLGVVEKQKSLQNLNDVLGKKAGNAKTTKKSNGN
uniref:Uncharacterized protein n=1 Tax=Sphaerodactylus townsendi TaxID=933632 RepID=A0ACB8EN48_9SAUR